MGMIGNSLAQGLISGANIQDGTVDTPDIKDSAVTAAKIASAVITPGKLTTGAPTWDANSNVGVGTALSGWSGSAGSGVVQLKNGGSLFTNTIKDTYLGANYFFDGTNNKYIADGYATQFGVASSTGAFVWSSSSSGTAGATATLNQRMALDASGDWYLGGSSNPGSISGRNLLINAPTGTANKITFTVNGLSQGYIYHNASELAIGAPSGTAINFQIAGGGTKATIDSSGRLCVNTTTGSGLITINNNSADGTSDYAQGLVFSNNTSGAGPWTHAAIWTVGSSGYSGNLIFGTDGDGNNNRTGITEKARIDSSGKLGVGNTNPQARLDLGSSYGADGEKFLIYNDNNTSALAGTKMGFYIDRFGESNSATFVFPYASGTSSKFHVAYKATAGTTITDVCSVTAGSSSWSFASDERMKDIIEPITGALAMLDGIRTVYYSWKLDESKKRKVGTLAQDWLVVAPEVVDVPETEFDLESSTGHMTLAGTDTIPILIAAIKELKSEFDAYKEAHP